jgi:hypothetical protein
MDEKKSSELWVGQYGEEKNVVYDPDMQSQSNVGGVYLFEVFSGRMVSYNRQQIRVQLVKVNDIRKIRICTAKYRQWMSWHGYEFQKDVLHRKDVKTFNGYYRNTKCWVCGRKVTSLNGEICEKCGWLKCPKCGACEEGCSETSQASKHGSKLPRD